MAIGAAIAVAGAVLGAAGQRKAGKAAKKAAQREQQAAEFEALQLEQEAKESQALAQMAAREEERRARLVASRALALAAAGGSASDPGIANLIADIDGEGAYRAALALYQGESDARKLRMGATTRRISGRASLERGKATQQAYNLQAIGTVLGTGASLYKPEPEPASTKLV